MAFVDGRELIERLNFDWLDEKINSSKINTLTTDRFASTMQTAHKVTITHAFD